MKYVGQNVEDELRSRRDSAAVQAEEPVEGQAPVRAPEIFLHKVIIPRINLATRKASCKAGRILGASWRSPRSRHSWDTSR